MRMRFSVEDEQAYRSTRQELCDGFAAWQGVDARRDDVETLLDWKWGYADGDLGRWTVDDIDEFLLGWCPAKLCALPDQVATIPDTVASFMEFLAHRDLLAAGNPGPSALRRHCAERAPRFRREMADPGNYGMAEALLGGLIDIEADQLPETGDPGEPRVIGPVRLPDPHAHLESVRRAAAFQQVRGLAERCPTPGLALTKKGNLRLADARRLVDELATGDELENPFRKLASAEELPGLGRVLELALAVGAVRRYRGKLVAVSTFARLDDTKAFRRLVRAALEVGPGEPATLLLSTMGPLHGLADDLAPQLLAELLDLHVGGVQWLATDAVVEAFVGVASLAVPGLAGIVQQLLGDRLATVLDSLVELGLLEVPEDPGRECRCAVCAGQVALTPSGVTAAAELVAELPQVEVVLRPEPAKADAETMVASLGQLDEETAVADLVAWSATRTGGAAVELVAALATADRPDADLLGGLDLAEQALGKAVEEAVMAHLDGPRDPLVLSWLLTRGALHPATVDRGRMLAGMAAVAAVFLEVEGPEGVVGFVDGGGRAEVLDLLEQLWRVDHPRMAEVLEAIGTHPDAKLAKAARRSLMRYRSRIAPG